MTLHNLQTQQKIVENKFYVNLFVQYTRCFTPLVLPDNPKMFVVSNSRPVL